MGLSNDLPSSEPSFASPPRIAWSALLGGSPPGSIRVFPAAERILVSIEPMGDQARCSVVCFDWDGQVMWARPEMRGWLALAGTQYLVGLPTGQPAVVDGEGRVVHTFDAAGITQAALHGDLLVMAHDRRVWAVNRDLRPAWSFDWPGGRAADVSCLVDGVFYYVEDEALRFCAPAGGAGVLGVLPRSLMNDAYDEFTSLTGRATEVPSISPLWRGLWFDAGANCFFLTSFLPHVVVCVDASGRVRWHRCLGPGCCGGAPCPLPDGRYAVSGGCNGVVSWLDDAGRLLFQSLPHPGPGLASAYSSELVILPDGTVVVGGGPGLVAYGGSGEHLWTWARGAIDRVYDAGRKVLVCSSWRTWGKGEATGYLEVLRLDGAGGPVDDEEPNDLRREIARQLAQV